MSGVHIFGYERLRILPKRTNFNREMQGRRPQGWMYPIIKHYR